MFWNVSWIQVLSTATPTRVRHQNVEYVAHEMSLLKVVDKTRNMEHPGTFRNIPEHRIIMIIMRKICKIKLSKTEKTSNLEAAMLKLHKYYHFMILL